MLSVLLVSVASTAAIRVSLLSQTYNQMAQTAGDAGVVYAKACLDANDGVPKWSDIKPLGPNTDCWGDQLPNFTCLAGTVEAKCFVSINAGSAESGAITSTFSVGIPVLVNGKASEVNSVGSTKLLRKSSTASVWRQYNQSTRLSIPVAATSSVIGKVLVVAGGGGGGNGADRYNNGGGGGGGGVIYNPNYSISVGAKTVTVAASVAANTKGNNSVFGSIIATGGGRGGGGLGAYGDNGSVGGDGGSGGGGSALNNLAGGLAYPTGQGYNGSSGCIGTSNNAGGGGGGAGQAGIVCGTSPGQGGNGISNSISGAAVVYGGGGSGGNDSAVIPGGSGGGGSGAYYPDIAFKAGNGSLNTGGGGGGGASRLTPMTMPGGNGGSGIVIVSYLTGSITAFGGTITYIDSNGLNPRSNPSYAGGYTVHTFISGTSSFTVN